MRKILLINLFVFSLLLLSVSSFAKSNNNISKKRSLTNVEVELCSEAKEYKLYEEGEQMIKDSERYSKKNNLRKLSQQESIKVSKANGKIKKKSKPFIYSSKLPTPSKVWVDNKTSFYDRYYWNNFYTCAIANIKASKKYKKQVCIQVDKKMWWVPCRYKDHSIIFASKKSSKFSVSHFGGNTLLKTPLSKYGKHKIRFRVRTIKEGKNNYKVSKWKYSKWKTLNVGRERSRELDSHDTFYGQSHVWMDSEGIGAPILFSTKTYMGMSEYYVTRKIGKRKVKVFFVHDTHVDVKLHANYEIKSMLSVPPIPRLIHYTPKRIYCTKSKHLSIPRIEPNKRTYLYYSSEISTTVVKHIAGIKGNKAELNAVIVGGFSPISHSLEINIP